MKELFILTMFIFNFYQLFPQTLKSPNVSIEGSLEESLSIQEADGFVFLDVMEKPINQINNHPNLSQVWVYNVKESDEFDGNSLNVDKWRTNYGWGNHHPAHQHYNTIENMDIQNGIISFKTKYEPKYELATGYKDSFIIDGDGKKNQRLTLYTSAMIASNDSTLYGYYEI